MSRAPKPGGRDAGADERVPDAAGARGRYVDLDAVFARVPGARDDDHVADRPRTANRGTAAASRRHLGEQRPRLGTLHREHRARRGDVGELDTSPARRASRPRRRPTSGSVFDAFGMTKKSSSARPTTR